MEEGKVTSSWKFERNKKEKEKKNNKRERRELLNK